MDLKLLTKRYLHLAQELAIEYRVRPWVGSRIDRIANDIADTERAIASLDSASDHSKSLWFGGALHDHA